ncbi:MAG: hypothetical protein U0R51_00125 [Solirubrobacterales bacterium]
MESPELNEEVVRSEGGRANLVMIGTLAGILAVFFGNLLQSTGAEVDADDAEQLINRSEHSSTILIGSIVAGLGFVVLGLVLLFIFSAARRRNLTLPTTLRPLFLIGPILLLASNIITGVAYDSVATDFINAGATTGDDAAERAKDLIANSGGLQAGAFVGLAGVAAFSVTVIYTAFQAMRVGLQTRFWGTLGMAFGAAFLLSFVLGPIGFLGILLWFLQAGLQPSGRWIGGKLPAWEMGVAVPWPDSKASPPKKEDELASPSDFEGTATEIESEPDPSSGEGPQKRKRKRRS